MRAGFSRRSFRFERAATKSGTGQKNGWAEIATTRVQTMKKIGTEGNNSAAETALNNFVFRVRYQLLLADLSVRDRMVDARSGQVFDIVSVINVREKNRELEIAATAIQ